MRLKRIVAALVCASVIVGSVSYNTFAEEHTHNYEYMDKENGTHDKKCNCMEEPENEEHTFEDGVCICGAEESEAGLENEPEPQVDTNEKTQHEHEYTYTDKENGTHDKFCECMEEPENEVHVFQEGVCVCLAKEPDESGEIEVQAEHEHNYIYTDKENGTHDKICECMKSEENETHIYENGVCICGNEKKTKSRTNYDGYEFEYVNIYEYSDNDKTVNVIKNESNNDRESIISYLEECELEPIKIDCLNITFGSDSQSATINTGLRIHLCDEYANLLLDGSTSLEFYRIVSRTNDTTIEICPISTIDEATFEVNIGSALSWNKYAIVFAKNSESIGTEGQWEIKDKTLYVKGEWNSYYSPEQYPWYAYKNIINTVVFEEGVTKVPGHAFSHYYQLKNVYMSNITEIGSNAFYYCKNLSTVTMPQSEGRINFRQDSFRNCTSLEELDLNNDSVVFFGDGCFCDSGIREIALDDGARLSFGGSALSNSKISDVILSSKYDIIGIGEAAFAGCENFRNIEIKIPIGRRAFENCKNLETVVFADDCENVKIDNFTFAGCVSLKKIVFPKELLYINFQAFAYCDNLVEIDIPNSGAYISSYAFSDCKNLQKITIPETVRVADDAFSGCRNIRSIDLEGKVMGGNHPNLAPGDWHAYYFLRKGQSAESISLGNKVIMYEGTLGEAQAEPWYREVLSYSGSRSQPQVMYNISNTEFNYWSDLYINKTKEHEISIPNSIEEIPNWAFSDENYKKIELPSSVVSAGNNTFNDLAEVVLHRNGVTPLYGTIAERINSVVVEFDEGIEEIGTFAFHGLSCITEIEVPSTVKRIGNYAFYECSGIEKIDLSNVEEIGGSSFERCVNLKQVKFNKVQLIEGGAFSYDTELIAEIPETCTNISSGAFQDCKEIIVHVNDEYVERDYESAVWNNEQNIADIIRPYYDLGGYNGPIKQSLVIEGTPRRIGKYALSIYKINSIAIPSGVEAIDEGAFSFSNITSIEIPEGVKTINDYSFAGCSNLKNVSLPRTLEKISPKAFSYESQNYRCENIILSKYCVTGNIEELFAGQIEKVEKKHEYTDELMYNEEGHYYACYCGKIDTILPHNIIYGDIIEQSTHVQNGLQEVACSDCNFNGIMELPKSGTHNFAEIFFCNFEGHWNECICGEISDFENHMYGDWKVALPATHITEGIKMHRCIVCEYEETDIIKKKLEHDIDATFDWNVDSHWNICQCGSILNKESHQFTEWIVVVEPTYSSEGTKMKSCECGYKIYQSIPKKNQSDIRIEMVSSGAGAPDSSITYMSNYVRDNIYNGLSSKEQAEFEKGSPVKVYSKVNSLTISETGKKALNKAAGNDTSVLIYLDISMYIKVGNLNEREIEPGGPVSVKFELPEEYRTNKKRTYKILHLLSDGNVEMLTCYYNANDNTITFTTASFSEFALAYTEQPETPNMSGEPDLIQKPGKENETTYDSKDETVFRESNAEKNQSNNKSETNVENRTIVVTSALPYMTISGLSTGVPGDVIQDMKSLVSSERDRVNQKIYANYFADQKKLKAKVIDTKDIYAPYTATNEWKKTSRIISWKNTGLKLGDMAYAVWYCQEAHDMRFIPAIVSENGTVYFAVPMTGTVSTVSIVKCSL